MNELYLKLDKNISIIITGKKNTLHVKFSILLAVWVYDAENTMVHSSPSGTTRKRPGDRAKITHIRVSSFPSCNGSVQN